MTVAAIRLDANANANEIIAVDFGDHDSRQGV